MNVKVTASPEAQKPPRELSFRGMLLSFFLTIILALSNSWLALKLGILTSASIPAAIIAMTCLRWFKDSSMLESNLVQTAASAGEAVAGGIVYTIPALVIIHYWYGFDYWTNVFIAAFGGILGVFFSIPLRRILVHDESLRFPEGRAISEVLKAGSNTLGVSGIALGGLFGGLLELFESGFHLIAAGYSQWFVWRHTLFGIGAGFSATMIGAGFLIGHEMGISIILGAILMWFFVLPLVSLSFHNLLGTQTPNHAFLTLWNEHLRYVGIGAMLFAGLITFLALLKPLMKNITLSLGDYFARKTTNDSTLLTSVEKDLPMPFIFFGIFFLIPLLYCFFAFLFPLSFAGLHGSAARLTLIGAVFYVFTIGFLFSIITAWLSGMVGVTASPGSAVVIGGMLMAASLLLMLFNHLLPIPLDPIQIKAAEAMTIMIGSVVTGIAAIANDNTQDLKVGQLIGATPWKQQVMLLFGVLVSSLVIPPVMQLLFDVYGIAGVMPRPDMNPEFSLPAPTAALMAALTQAVFQNTIPWGLMLLGAGMMLVLHLIIKRTHLNRWFQLSIPGVSIGMYLPITSSFPLFLGAMMAFSIDKTLSKKHFSIEKAALCRQKGVLMACGLVAGAALMDVLLAIPFSLLNSPHALALAGSDFETGRLILAILSMGLLYCWLRFRILNACI